MIMICVLITNNAESRAKNFFNSLFDNFTELNITLHELDSSGSTRIYLNVIGYLIAIENIFSVGKVNYGYSWEDAFSGYHISLVKKTAHLTLVQF